MNQGAGYEKSTGFAGRKFIEPAISEVSNFELSHGFFGSGFHFGQDVVVGPDADGAEEAGENEFAAFDIASALDHEIVADKTDVVPEFEDVPAIGTEDAE